jgi:hypothetical protein
MLPFRRIRHLGQPLRVVNHPRRKVLDFRHVFRPLSSGNRFPGDLADLSQPQYAETGLKRANVCSRQHKALR